MLGGCIRLNIFSVVGAIRDIMDLCLDNDDEPIRAWDHEAMGLFILDLIMT